MYNDLILYFFGGHNPGLWISSKLLMSFMGGIAAYLIQNEYFIRPGIKKLSFFEGLIFSIFSSIGGIALLNPTGAGNALIAGLVGVTAMSNFINKYNEGASDKKFINKELGRDELEELKDDK